MKYFTGRVPKWVRVLVPSIIILVWMVLGGIGGPYFGKIDEVASNDQSTFLPGNAESTKVAEELKKFKDSEALPAIVIFSNNQELSKENITRIGDETKKLADLSGVTGAISPPVISDDNKAALVVINIKNDGQYKELVPELKDRLDGANLGVQYSVTGPVGFLSDLGTAFSGIDGLLLGVALTVVFIILLVVYRSPILPFIVLLNSIFALAVSILVVFYLAKTGVVTLNGQVQGILFILVVGAATDYTLLFIARYREELHRHKKTYQAILASWKRSLEPILAAGGTVIAGLLCLLLSDLNSNKALGPVGGIGITLAVTSTLTLLPCLLLMWGRTAFWPRIPKYKNATHSEAVNKKGVWGRTARLVRSHARATWIVTSLLLLTAAAGLLQLKANGVPQSDLILGKSEAREGQKLLDKHFPGGSGTPAQIIVSADKINDVISALEADKGVASVSARANNSSTGTKPLGKAENELKAKIRNSTAAQLDLQKKALRQQIEGESLGAPTVVIDQAYEQAVNNLPSIDAIVSNAYPFKDATVKIVNNKALLEVTLQDSADSETAQTTIERLRTSLDKVDSSSQVGGPSAVQLDVQTSAEHDRTIIIPVVLAVITIILMVLLRSVLAPILLLFTTMLSFAASLGVAALLFNHVWNFPGADPSVILYGFIFLVALGIDYNIFLMTRVREESLRIGTRKGVLLGLVVTGGVITSAGIVLAATFAALAVIPILFLAQLAFIVSFGVLIDTIIVRSLLVPALVHDIGPRVWWPSRKNKK